MSSKIGEVIKSSTGGFAAELCKELDLRGALDRKKNADKELKDLFAE